MADIKALVAQNIRELRHQAGLTQQKLADLTGISLSYVNYLENQDSDVTVTSLERLAEALGVPVGRLVSENDQAIQTPPREAMRGLQCARSMIQSAIDMIEAVEAESAKNSRGPSGKSKAKGRPRKR